MAARSKKKQIIREATEFNMAQLTAEMAAPTETGNVYAWDLCEILSARDAQMRGSFAIASKLAKSMRTDDAIGVARRNRLAPQRCIRRELKAAKGARGTSVCTEAQGLYGEDGVAISAGTRADINGCLVDHGVAFAFNSWTAREDGSRVDVEVKYWPIEFVRWDAYRKTFLTRVALTIATTGFGEVAITHGDGRWLIFANHDFEPFNQDAAIVDGALVWASRAFGIRDWAQTSTSHGSAKVVGEMPEGVPLQETVEVDGVVTTRLTPQAIEFQKLLVAMASGDAACGIRPAGSETEFVSNNSSAWQVFVELVGDRSRAAARIYLGTDGTLGATGGAPGVDISQLFGVNSTKVQGDLGAIARGMKTGSIDIWTAINFGDSSLAPTMRYMLPDADGDADRASLKVRNDAFFAHLDAAKKAGAAITQDYVDEVAKLYDVESFTLAPPATTPAAAPGTPALHVVRS